jgi:PST family polysaccharide transporter
MLSVRRIKGAPSRESRFDETHETEPAASTRNVIIALYLVYVLNYALPLLTLPYLSHVLGPAGLGTIGYAQSIAQILLVIVDFGFGLSSARKVAVHLEEPDVVNKIYWATTIAKGVLAAACSLILALFAFAVPMSHDERIASLMGALIIWGGVITPYCLFEGVQRRLPTLYGMLLATRAVLLVPLFLFVKSSSDVVIAAVLQYSPTFVSGLLLATLMIYRRKISFKVRVHYSEVISEAKDACHIFLGSAMTSVYVYANVVLLRAISGTGAVGYYVAAERLTNALRQFTAPAIQTFFPKVCRAYARGDLPLVHKINRRFMVAFGMSAVMIFVGFSAFGEWFVREFLGDQFGETFAILRVLVFVPVIIGMTTTQVMLSIVASGNQALLKRIYILGAAFHICQAPVCTYLWDGVGTACSVAATELFMLVIAYAVSAKINSGQISVRIVGAKGEMATGKE